MSLSITDAKGFQPVFPAKCHEESKYALLLQDLDTYYPANSIDDKVSGIYTNFSELCDLEEEEFKQWSESLLK